MPQIRHFKSFASTVDRDAYVYPAYALNQWVRVDGTPPTTYQITSVSSSGVATFAQLGGGGAPTAHHTTHENGGTDEISVAGLSGLLADPQTPTTHAASHLPGGTDALTTAAAGTISVGDAAAVGSAASFARSDHVHAVTAPSAPADVTKAAAAAGSSAHVAREDHKHDISTAAAGAATPGDSAAEGTATSLARSDHKHSLPAFGTTSGTFAQGNDSRFSNPQSERWYPPATAHASDDEYTSDPGTYTLYNNTPTVETITNTTIDPYANTTTQHHIDYGSYRRSWVTMQLKADSNDYFLTKPWTPATNVMVYTRLGPRMNQSDTVARIGLSIFPSASSKPDPANRITFMVKAAGSLIYTLLGFKLVAGVETDVVNVTTAAGIGALIEYVGIHKISTTYHMWAWGPGYRFYLGSTTHASTFAYAGYQVRSVSTASGSPVMDADFIRFVDSATFTP